MLSFILVSVTDSLCGLFRLPILFTPKMHLLKHSTQLISLLALILLFHGAPAVIEVGGYHIADSCTKFDVKGQTVATYLYFTINRLQDLIRNKVIPDTPLLPTAIGPSSRRTPTSPS